MEHHEGFDMNETSMDHHSHDDERPDDWGGAEPTPAPAVLISSRNKRSSSFGKMAAAMAKAQGAMKGAVKDSANPFFKSKYADLASVWSDCREPLSTNEIAVFQMPATDGKKVTITTLLAHPSDQWLENELEMESKDASPQGVGSAITYARRYALAAMVGAYQIDDDAEQAQGRDKQQQGPTEIEAKLLASNFKAALDTGIDGRIFDVHQGANADQDLYSAAWKFLSAAERREIKAAIERVKVPNTNRPARETAEA
jgi:hypothetical protein